MTKALVACSFALGLSAMPALLAQHTASAQTPLTAAAFEGVWKVTKVVKAGVVDDNPQPGLTIFSGGYFSIVRVTSSGARKAAPAPKDPANLTDAEKIARYEEWAPFGAAAGRYEVRGHTLVTHNFVAKAAANMTLTEEATISFEGDRFVAKATDGPNVGRETTYTRVR